MSDEEKVANRPTGTGQQATGYRFRDWFACPKCDERDDISTLSHNKDIVFECYDCGLISEFVIGEDTLQNIDSSAITDLDDEQISD